MGKGIKDALYNDTWEATLSQIERHNWGKFSHYPSDYH